MLDDREALLEDLEAIDADAVTGAGIGLAEQRLVDPQVQGPEAGTRRERDRYGAHAGDVDAGARRSGGGWDYEVRAGERGARGHVEDPV